MKTILRQPFNETLLTTLEAHLEKLRYNISPSWLGGFGFRMFGGPYEKKVALPYEFNFFKETLAKLVPEQHFDTVFCQRYTTGQAVHTHRDPKNNVAKTVILVLGKFTGAKTTIEDESFQLNRGDVLVLDCTIAGKQGPKHSVSKVESGTRYAFILNTIVSK